MLLGFRELEEEGEGAAVVEFSRQKQHRLTSPFGCHPSFP